MHCTRGTFHKIIIDPKLNQLFRISEVYFVQNTVLQSTKLHWKHCNGGKDNIYIFSCYSFRLIMKSIKLTAPSPTNKTNDFQKY